jgi:hypothetical protein
LRDRLFVANQPRTQQMYALLRSEWRGWSLIPSAKTR